MTDISGTPEPKPETFGTWLRHCREGFGLTRSVFAAFADISVADQKAIECHRRLPTAEQRQRLIKVVADHDPKLAATAPAPEPAPPPCG